MGSVQGENPENGPKENHTRRRTGGATTTSDRPHEAGVPNALAFHLPVAVSVTQLGHRSTPLPADTVGCGHQGRRRRLRTDRTRYLWHFQGIPIPLLDSDWLQPPEGTWVLLQGSGGAGDKESFEGSFARLQDGDPRASLQVSLIEVTLTGLLV